MKDTDDDTTGTAAPGRLVLLTTSHRVAPGQLSWQAWQTLQGADQVVCPDPDHPQLPYLREAGVRVEVAAPGGRELAEATAGSRTVVYVAPSGGADPAVTDELARLGGSGRIAMPDLELLPGSYDLPGARLLDLVQVMERIRAECPWSSLRTHEDLAKYGIEEMYELVEAIEEGDRPAMREELGDVLLQVVFHAAIAEGDPQEPFGIDDVAAGLVDKLVHRHPHIFGDEIAETPEQVQANWIRLKGEEKARESVTDGIPLASPALALAAKLAGRARGAGLPLPAAPAAPGGQDPALRYDDETALGDHLLAEAAAAQSTGVDPEAALRHAARRYRAAIRAAEGIAEDGPAAEDDVELGPAAGGSLHGDAVDGDAVHGGPAQADPGPW
ncbi:nucleoside triphosphate pyrophosphohydrolase [Actinacidiphila acididurans]|uniref:Nucleoside triphosphate pyrophosphohydrolase n=1 Tax=Actinacidiphila acididurans TaxID=2784346 RepID=A0ABS2TNS0_9ACTN|nr:nucleoside triphosphate pyrophosphohydrolase [Actinacidiphila acididurans]MBM9504988.1 nucleoside triphosphate pyrophosphohydrolase [Actinacidiphila acididurans]